MEQWPLTAEKLQAVEHLVMEKLTAGHIEPSNSPCHIPIFVINGEKKKRRLLQDLRAINATMEDMGPSRWASLPQWLCLFSIT